MSKFEWTPARARAAMALAEGLTLQEAAQEAGVTIRSISRWKLDPDFLAEVDRLTLMTGIAIRAERIRIAKKVIRQKMRDGDIQTDKDALDWLKFAQGETDGVKLDLAALADAAAQVAGQGSD